MHGTLDGGGAIKSVITITSDNRKAAGLLKKMASLIVKHGGYINPRAEIRCRDGEVSVHAPREIAGERLFALPHDLLLPFAAFEIDIQKDKFVLTAIQPEVTAPQKALMKAMLALYNALDKVRAHRAASPWVIYQDSPAIMDLFLKCRYGDEFAKMRDMLEDGRDNEFAQTTFFKTRVLTCRLHKAWGRQADLLLPLIDALNHNVLGAAFDHQYEADGAALNIACKHAPDTDSDECFVSYGRMDALDSYLHYGFIDEAAPFVRSVPLVITLEEGVKLHLQASYGSVEAEELPESVRDLKFFMPAIGLDEQARHMQLSHLLIPGQKGVLSMRRILQYALAQLLPDLSAEERAKRIANTERIILEANVSFYNDMEEAAQNMDADKREAIQNLANLQKSKIVNYIQALNNAVKQGA